jgi:ABC-type transporter Mla subunit MlaD
VPILDVMIILSALKATLAQLVEQRIRNAWVGGSSPPGGSLANQSNLRPNSRIVGYGTALVVGLLVLWFSWRIYVYTVLERDYVWVHFTGSGDLIGSLQEDDPVAIQGVGVGQVEDIESTTDGVRVRLRFWKHQRLYRDAHSTNVGNGLMGMRFVLLEPGVDSTHLLDRNADIPGQFRPGIAEVMSGIEEVIAKVRALRAKTSTWANGDSIHEPIPHQVLEKLRTVDALLDRTDRFQKRMQVVGPAVRRLTSQSLAATRSMDSTMPSILAGLRTTDTLLIEAKGMIGSLRALSRDADTTVQGAATGLAPFAKNDSLLLQIQDALKIVDQVQAFVDGKAKIKYKFHVLGSNPSKHGE